MKRIGIVFNASMEAATALARSLTEQLSGQGHDCWQSPAGYDDKVREQARQTDLIITVGGDGTILRTARFAVPGKIPILGVNMGKVGFMTEMDGAVALEQVPRYVNSEGWIEERAILDVQVTHQGNDGPEVQQSWALNEVVVGRAAPGRLVSIDARIDSAELTTYKADGVIIATATGSTAYALAAGGPVMDPRCKELLLLPVSPHLSLANPIVVHQDSVVELTVGADHDATASLDGQFDYRLHAGDVIRAQRGDQVARFLRAKSPTYFYATLTRRLNMRGTA
ncbi:MAG: NAD(+)/NADH kinase [Dehalococcoidia bacterium]